MSSSNSLTTAICVVWILAFLASVNGQLMDRTTVQLGGQLSETILEYVVNRADVRAGGKDTVTIKYSIPKEGWISLGFTDGNGMMIGAEAVIGLPDTGEVQKYSLSSYENAGIVPMPEAQQTLIDTVVVQEGGSTTMEFTKILNETGEIPIAIGSNTFIGAFGFNNMFFYHEKRDSFDLDLVAGAVEVIETRKRSLWKAHGWCAALAWGFLSPLAIGAAILRVWFPDGLWLKIHQYLNNSVLVLTILAFAFGVAAIQSETPSGGDPKHFDPSPSPHRLIGLVAFVLVLFQILGGQYRPNNPAKGEEKSLTRRVWEVSHRFLGIALLAIAWYQIQSGIRIYQKLFDDSASANLIAIFWSVVGTISCGIAVGFVRIKITEKKEEEKEDGDRAVSDEEEMEDNN